AITAAAFTATAVAAATFAAAAIAAAAFAATAIATAAAVTTTAAAVTTTAAAVTAAAVATATTAAAAWRTWLHRTRFVDDHAAAAERLAVHTLDRCLCFRIAAHFNETKTLGTAGIALHHHFGTRHRTIRAEC